MIRQASPADLGAICALNESVQALHVVNRPETFRPLRAHELTAHFAELLQDPSAKIWVSVADDLVNGYLVGIVRTQAPTLYVLGRTWFELDQMGVAAAARRTGVARALVQQGLTFAQARGIQNVELSSWSFNQDAQSAFQKLGFTPKTVRFEHRQ
ncbi:MAG: GNAT family N-acetyltransferase [Polyangiaceae bacterium]